MEVSAYPSTLPCVVAACGASPRANSAQARSGGAGGRGRAATGAGRARRHLAHRFCGRSVMICGRVPCHPSPPRRARGAGGGTLGRCSRRRCRRGGTRYRAWLWGGRGMDGMGGAEAMNGMGGMGGAGGAAWVVRSWGLSPLVRRLGDRRSQGGGGRASTCPWAWGELWGMAGRWVCGPPPRTTWATRKRATVRSTGSREGAVGERWGMVGGRWGTMRGCGLARERTN